MSRKIIQVKFLTFTSFFFMSGFLPDDELTGEELRILSREEKRFSRAERRRLRAAHSRVGRRIFQANFPLDEQQHSTSATTPYPTTIAYVKIGVSSGQIQFNSNLFERVKKLIRNQFGRHCYGNTLKCTSITITPKPGNHCCLFYKAEGYSWDPIGQFFVPAGSEHLRMPLKCPYVDSIFRNQQVVWPFFKNDNEGRIVPWNYQKDYHLHFNNQSMPFLEENMLGQICISGLQKEVTLDVIFIMPDHVHRRETPVYHRYFRSGGYFTNGPPHARLMDQRRMSGQIGYENVPEIVQGPDLPAYDWSDLDTDDIMAE